MPKIMSTTTMPMIDHQTLIQIMLLYADVDVLKLERTKIKETLSAVMMKEYIVNDAFTFCCARLFNLLA